MRSTTDAITSEQENSFFRIPAATSTALFCHNSSPINRVPSAGINGTSVDSDQSRPILRLLLIALHSVLHTNVATIPILSALPRTSSELWNFPVVFQNEACPTSVGNLDETEKRRPARHAGLNGPQDSRCPRPSARLWNCPPHRADQRRSACRQSRHSLSRALETRAGRLHRLRLGSFGE